MTAPDLELVAGLSADELRMHSAHEAQVETSGRNVVVVRSVTRVGLSGKMQARGCYRDFALEKRLSARKHRG
jgi:hypothetical protein